MNEPLTFIQSEHVIYIHFSVLFLIKRHQNYNTWTIWSLNSLLILKLYRAEFLAKCSTCCNLREASEDIHPRFLCTNCVAQSTWETGMGNCLRLNSADQWPGSTTLTWRETSPESLTYVPDKTLRAQWQNPKCLEESGKMSLTCHWNTIIESSLKSNLPWGV